MNGWYQSIPSSERPIPSTSRYLLIQNSTYFSSLYPDSDYWQPLPELKQPFGSTLAILFVSSLHIYYEEPTLDPIFYANEPRDFKGLRKSFYYNSDPRARVLACVDKSEVCSPDGKICWSMISPVPDKVPSPPSYWLMKWSLENSNTYDAIKWRLGTALLAQESVSQSVSLPLPHNQWQVEAAQLFATSLARIQYDALAIAMGEGHQRPGYIDVTPDEAKDRLCGLYKLKTSTYTNINLVAFVGLLMLAISIVILSLPVQTKPIGNDEQKPSSQPLMIEVILTFMYNLLVEIPSMIRNIFKFMYGVVSKKP